MSNTMSLSCTQCAKRKVRCDRTNPCSNCRRREGDVCEYPIVLSRSTGSPAIRQSKRLERLEQYVRSLGGDPDQVMQGPSDSRDNSCETPSCHDEAKKDQQTDQQNNHRGTKRKLRNNIRPSKTDSQRDSPQGSTHARLVEHEEQTTYIEAPMWYSWSEANQMSNQTSQLSLEQRSSKPSTASRYNTLLDPLITVDRRELDNKHPTIHEISELWEMYLRNVHPMVKIFFDWDKEPLMQKAAKAPATLSQEEVSLVFAIYFITILSLSEEECKAIVNYSTRSQLLDHFQSVTETALVAAGFSSTSELLTLQALILYLLAIRDRARPATWFSLQGVAVRIAQRLGLHRDGSFLGLPPIETEERRRVWWQLQHMEIIVCQLVGCLSMTLYGHWDTKMPSNLDDSDLHMGMAALPTERRELTSMSYCLWRHYVLYMQRSQNYLEPGQDGISWAMSPHVSLAEKDAMVESFEKELGERFLQHCDPLNPPHVHIQIGIRTFLLACQRLSRQPSISNAKISEIPKTERDEFLKISVKWLEYYVLGESTPAIQPFRWHNGNYFQWTLFVHVLIEAHHRATTSDAPSLWVLIDKVCRLHLHFMKSMHRSEFSAIGRLTILAWRERQNHVESLKEQAEKPWCVAELEERLSFYPRTAQTSETRNTLSTNDFTPIDFDMIDWSFWEKEASLETFA